MAVEYGISSKGNPTVLYRNFEYVKDKDIVCGTIAWRCRLHQTMKISLFDEVDSTTLLYAVIFEVWSGAGWHWRHDCTGFILNELLAR